MQRLEHIQAVPFHETNAFICTSVGKKKKKKILVSALIDCILIIVCRFQITPQVRTKGNKCVKRRKPGETKKPFVCFQYAVQPLSLVQIHLPGSKVKQRQDLNNFH